MKRLLVTGLLAIGLSVSLSAKEPLMTTDNLGYEAYNYPHYIGKNDTYNKSNYKKVKGNVGANSVMEAMEIYALALSTQDEKMLFGIYMPQYDKRRNIDLRELKLDGDFSRSKQGFYDKYEIVELSKRYVEINFKGRDGSSRGGRELQLQNGLMENTT